MKTEIQMTSLEDTIVRVFQGLAEADSKQTRTLEISENLKSFGFVNYQIINIKIFK